MEKSFLIINDHGLHARPAANFVRCASSIPVHVIIKCENEETDAKSIMGLIAMRIVKGQTITIVIDGNNVKFMETIENHLQENQIAEIIK